MVGDGTGEAKPTFCHVQHTVVVGVGGKEVGWITVSGGG